MFTIATIQSVPIKILTGNQVIDCYYRRTTGIFIDVHEKLSSH